MDPVVCIDRDGTLIYDDHYYLGSQDNWEELIEILPGVVEGVKELNKSGFTTYMITNQSGIAVKDMDKLTEERAHIVCQEVMDRIAGNGASLDGYYLCPHVTPSHAASHTDGRTFHDDLVCNCNCVKPNPGMIDHVLDDAGISQDEARIYMIGDRVSDVKAGINAGGTGILVPFKNQNDQKGMVTQMQSDKTCIADDVKDAVDYILQENLAEAGT